MSEIHSLPALDAQYRRRRGESWRKASGPSHGISREDGAIHHAGFGVLLRVKFEKMNWVSHLRLPLGPLANASAVAILLRVSVAIGAESTEGGDLDEVIALATRQEQISAGDSYDGDRCRALERLSKWPRVSPEDEARIADAFIVSLRGSSNVRNAAAQGLGARGHDEVLPTIFELSESDSNLIGGFVMGRRGHGEMQPPIALLKRGLLSANPDTRVAMLNAASSYKAVDLRKEIEAVLATDSITRVRDEAARAVLALELRESLPALREAFAGGLQSADVAYALGRLGTEKDIVAVLPLLKRNEWGLRETICHALAQARISKPRPVCDALLPLLANPSESVRRAAMQALAHFHDSRALPLILKAVTDSRNPIHRDYHRAYVTAVSDFGGEGAVTVLNAMAQHGFTHGNGLEEALIRFGAPSSGWVMWKMYLSDPVHVNYDSDVLGGGYRDALLVVTACADESLLRQVRARLASATDPFERNDLRQVVDRVEKRLGK